MWRERARRSNLNLTKAGSGKAESTIMLMNALLKMLTSRLELSRGALSTRAADSVHDEADVLELEGLAEILRGNC